MGRWVRRPGEKNKEVVVRNLAFVLLHVHPVKQPYHGLSAVNVGG